MRYLIQDERVGQFRQRYRPGKFNNFVHESESIHGWLARGE